MNPERKTRPDAILDHLPEERQAEIFAMLDKKSYAAVRKHLAADGIAVSENLLSRWRSRYFLRAASRQNEADTETVLEEIKREVPNLSDEQLFSFGQRIFGMLAIKQQNAEDWVKVQAVQIKRDAEDRERKQFQRETAELFIKWYADKEAAKVASSSMPNAEKLEKLGQIMFGEDW
ncbi:MAG TPA: hypothetical protein VN281_14700 [Verrucomicrobiae bacterium]|jgi:hypothetical protein|nr:hypothetical protein [Verrucomicrobiae bacterium]